MDITKIDKNFDTTFTAPEDIEWFSVRQEPFVTYGVTYSNKEGLYRRLPKEVADKVSEGVSVLATNTAGGRIKFITDSPYYAVKVTLPFSTPFSNMTDMCHYGVATYVDGVFSRAFAPLYEQIKAGDTTIGGNDEIVYDGLRVHLVNCERRNEQYEMEINLPPYSAVKEILVGLKKGSVILPPKPYKHSEPIIFYGSSITQGGCATKPGDDYISRLSRLLNFDYVNLGFSGNAKAEKVMVDYLAKQNPPIFVLDYDHNAPDAEYLEKTHYPLYQAIRDAHPNTPIILMTMPIVRGFENHEWFKTRREVILDNYQKMIDSGDKNVYLIDCIGCLGELVNGESATMDNTHPDSLGFLRMAERVYPVLSELLNKLEN